MISFNTIKWPVSVDFVITATRDKTRSLIDQDLV